MNIMMMMMMMMAVDQLTIVLLRKRRNFNCEKNCGIIEFVYVMNITEIMMELS